MSSPSSKSSLALASGIHQKNSVFEETTGRISTHHGEEVEDVLDCRALLASDNLSDTRGEHVADDGQRPKVGRAAREPKRKPSLSYTTTVPRVANRRNDNG